MNDTIEHINATIAANLRQALPTADLRHYALAESVALRGDEDITLPAIVLPDGECYDVYGETDKHDVVLYHRLGDITYNEDTRNAYGSGTTYTQVADMSLIVFGKREKISQFRMERIARQAIAQHTGCSLVRSDFNALQIFANEYAGVTYFMGSAYYLFKINYRITSTYNPRCN